MQDGLVLFYIKDGIIYPVALNDEQQVVFQLAQHVMPQPIKYVKDRPLGVAVNLVDGRRGK